MNSRNNDVESYIANIKAKAERRLQEDISVVQDKKTEYPSEQAYTQALDESREAYEKAIKVTAEIEDKLASAKGQTDQTEEADNDLTKQNIELICLLLDIGLNAPSASFRRFYAQKIVKTMGMRAFGPVAELAPQPPQPLQPLQLTQAQIEERLLQQFNSTESVKTRLREIVNSIKNTEKLSLKSVEVEGFLDSIPGNFANLSDTQKISFLSEQLANRKVTGSWQGYVVPEWLDKGLLIAALSVAIWDIVDAPEKERVLVCARESSVLTLSLASTGLTVQLFTLALAPETAGATLAIYLLGTIVGAITGEGAELLFESLFFSNNLTALTKELAKPLDKDLLESLSKPLYKKLQKRL
jgi:hypothetical protein